jgi:hypothetical protein
VYIEETCVFSFRESENPWWDDTNQELSGPISKGEGLNMVHAGGYNGLIPNTLLIWKAGHESGDYRNQRSQRIMKNNWVES